MVEARDLLDITFMASTGELIHVHIYYLKYFTGGGRGVYHADKIINSIKMLYISRIV